MATVETRDLAVKAAPVHISVAGRIDDRSYHMARILARSLQDENTHVTVSLLPMVETDWDEFVKTSAAVRGVVPYTV